MGCRNFGEVRRRDIEHCTEQNPHRGDKVKRKSIINASSKTHFNWQDNSSSNQDQVPFQYRKNSGDPCEENILTQIVKYLLVNLQVWCGQLLPEKNSSTN